MNSPIKYLSGIGLAVITATGCVVKPVVRNEKETLEFLGRTKVTTFSATGTVCYSGSEGNQEADFRCSVDGRRFRFTVFGPLGIVVSEAVCFGDSLFLYDAFNKILTITRPDRSLAPAIGAEIVPAEFVNVLLGILPPLDSLDGFFQEPHAIVLSYHRRFYTFRPRDLALVAITRPDAKVEFSDFVATDCGPRPRLIRIVSGGERTDITLRSQELNRPVSAERFRFSIPKGVEVRDLRTE